jgi:hypothetical protein
VSAGYDDTTDWDAELEQRAEAERDWSGPFGDERQSTTACCPRATIPDSCSCVEGCECVCTDCICGNWGDEELY